MEGIVLKDIMGMNSMKILKGLLISCVVTLMLLFIYAIVLTYTKIGENTMAPVIILITAVSILIRKLNSELVLLRKMEL